MGEPFDFVLSQLQLPPEVSGVGGRACLAEEAATGAQVTVEGYSFQGDVHVYGTVDSITCADSSSFLRYQYPSALPAAVTQRMAELSARVIRQIGLDGVTFNIEYFWDADHDTISLLEVNPRHSQSHAELFEQVDGVANHDHMLQLALGREPRPRHGEGPYDIAAKWFVRRTTDGVARRVPTAEEIERVERTIPGCTVDVTVAVGDRLSELYDQDSYSYALATVYLGADDEDELIRKYEQALEGLPFEFEEPDWMRFVDRQRFPHRIKEDSQLSIPLSDGTRLAGTGLAAGGGRPAPRPRHPRVRPVPAARPHRGAGLDPPPLLRGERVRGRPGRPARQRQLRGRAHRRVPRAGAVRRRGGAGLDRRAALVRRAHRDDGDLLGRVQHPPGRRATSAEPAGRRHRLLDRRPVRRRRALHGRLPAHRQPLVGVDDVRLQLLPAGPGRRRRGVARDVARSGCAAAGSGWRSGCATNVATPTGSTARSARTTPTSRARCSP